LAEEETVGQLHRVGAGRSVVETVDDTALPGQREDEPAAQRPELRRPRRRADELLAAAQAGEFEADGGRLATGRANAVVERIVDQRRADQRGRRRANRLAQVTPGEQRLAFAHAIAVEIGEELVLV